VILSNIDALGLELDTKLIIADERVTYLTALFNLIVGKYGITVGAQKYGTLLMMTSSIQVHFIL
jgi:hypothetical protein